MLKFSQVSETAFNELQVEAGVLLRNFDPESPELINEDIVCATTGGINPTCVPTYSDWAADVDNAKNNMMEFMRLDGWDCALGFTAVNITPEIIRMSLGAADIDGGKIVPRNTLDINKDFADLWWVGDRSDGGLVAICLKNALSTGGFSLQTNKKGKGQVSVAIKGHVSITAQNEVPMQFYVQDGQDEA